VSQSRLQVAPDRPMPIVAPVFRGSVAPVRNNRKRVGLRWLHTIKADRRTYPILFVSTQYVCQLALLSSQVGAFRAPVRMFAFGASLLLLMLGHKGKVKLHPAAEIARWILIVMVLSLLHPGLNSFSAGIAQILLYGAILAPLFWVGKLDLDLSTLVRVLALMCIFHTGSALVGVMQVQFPGQFQPALSTFSQTSGENLQGLYITTATGDRVFRPMGLTDQPGGAAISGFYAILMNIGFFLCNRRILVKGLCGSGVLIGFTCIYLCQVRSTFVIALLACCIVCVMLSLQGLGSKLIALGGILSVVAVGAIVWATYLGGEGIVQRFASLTEEAPDTVYFNNRGVFLEQTVNELLPQYPLGAGLGRWGMTNAYLGDNSDPKRLPIWVEIQITGWLLDGGIPLIIIYTIALLITVRTAFRLARSHSELSLWAIVLLTYDLSLVALTFSYPVFVSQLGMEFWFLNACLYAVSLNMNRERYTLSIRRTPRLALQY